jgi:hypothetical protein
MGLEWCDHWAQSQTRIISFLLGLVYKSPMTIRFNGNADFQTPNALAPLFPNGGFHTSLKFPQMAVAS